MLAVLGPTNTGKTHYAVERMLAYDSGCMGFPLRLLAREIYDRIRSLRGESQVALVTGEERVGRLDAPYVVATVEAMPLHRRYSFLAVDEIQLCADWERGHIFTDRLLNARGTLETIFLGSDTIRPLLKRLVPEAEIITRPRFSTLSYVGSARLDRLPRRSAIVAFRATDVYTIAEIIRRRKGGAAVVLGALSPRTRNAQVALYQAGEVEHLVATDAIGMGLNMDLAHVAFASLRKFDGHQLRMLSAAEVAQIAGRAGRHMADGTFGVTNGIGEIDPRIVEAVESHSFEPLKALRWRNSALDFSSLEALVASLDAPPPLPGLVKVRDALDDRSLLLLARRPEIRARADTPERVQLLWQVCQIPDYRKTLTDAHLHLLATVFGHLVGPRGRLPRDWVARMIARLDRTDGDIDTLAARIAHIRTWTYLSHRSDWMENAREFQERARSVEDRLSDALHERLTQRFVDRRTTALLRRLRERGTVEARVEEDGAVVVDGHRVGHVEGLRFTPETSEAELERRVLARTARTAVREELLRRARAIVEAGDEELAIENSSLFWRGAPLAKLSRGREPLHPRIGVLASLDLPPPLLRRIEERLDARIRRELEPLLTPLEALRRAGEAAEMPGPARGILYQLAEGLGNVPREAVEELLRHLEPGVLRQLGALGIRFGRLHLYHARLLRPAAIRARARLLGWWLGREIDLPASGATVLRDLEAQRPELAIGLGFVPFAGFGVRTDVAERLAAALRARARRARSFPLPVDLASSAGISRSELAIVLRALGYRRFLHEGREYCAACRRRPRRRRKGAAGSAVRTAATAPAAGPLAT